MLSRLICFQWRVSSVLVCFAILRLLPMLSWSKRDWREGGGSELLRDRSPTKTPESFTFGFGSPGDAVGVRLSGVPWRGCSGEDLWLLELVESWSLLLSTCLESSLLEGALIGVVFPPLALSVVSKVFRLSEDSILGSGLSVKGVSIPATVAALACVGERTGTSPYTPSGDVHWGVWLPRGPGGSPLGFVELE